MDSTPGGLHLRPQMIPALRQAYQEALDRLRPLLADAPDGFRIGRPAMGDQASAEFRQTFDQQAGAVAEQLTAFEQRLRETVDTLDAIQQAYQRNETATAAALTRRLES